MQINHSIFRAYDIRGIYPKELNEEITYKIGRAMVVFLNCKEVCVGQDARTSSPSLAKSLIQGIIDQGANVIDVGLCSTPLFYFATKNYEAGIMVTASHNPKEYNGFKFCRDGTVPIGGETGFEKIKKIVSEDEFPEIDIKGKIEKRDFLDEYINYCLEFKRKLKAFKVVIDTGNGMGGYTFPKLFEKIPEIEVMPLFWEINMTFPNHEANPLKPENVLDLQKAVKEHQADLGIAIDGDADRCMFVDELGQIVPGDLVTALLGEELLKKNPGALMFYDVRCSRVVKEYWKSLGARTNVCRVGHALIKKQMRDEDALFAGEFSAHYYFKELGFVENSIVSSLLILSIISKADKPFSEIVRPLKKYFQSGEINSEVEDKEGKMKELEEVYKNKAKNIFWLDGITVEFDDWWFNVRPSNTEPLLRLNLEAITKELMEEKKKELIEIIQSSS